MMLLDRGWSALLPILLTCLMALAGCGGGELVTDGHKLAQSSELIATERRLDVGVDGDGWLVLQTKDGDQHSYSRQGRLALDSEGRLVHADGSTVMGFMGGTNGPVAPLAMAQPAMMLSMTTRLELEANLDARLWLMSTPPAPAPAFHLADPTTYAFAPSVTIQTPTGSKQLTLYFRRLRIDPATYQAHWSVHFGIEGQVLDVESALRFTPEGLLDSWAPVTLRIAVQDGQPLHAIEIDLSRMMSFGSPNLVTDVVQDGHTAGTLTAADIGFDGALTFRYDNGESVYAGTVALAQFTAADELSSVGGSSWLCGRGCKPPTTGAPGLGSLGRLIAYALNVAYR